MKADSYLKSNRGITKIPVILCPPCGCAHLTSGKRALVCLVRHGQTDWNTVRRLQGREAVPLNETGIEQSKICGETFVAARDSGFSASHCYTSPLGRAVDTAKYVSKALGLGEPEVYDGLIERDYGALSGLTAEERRAVYLSGTEDPCAETVEETAARIKRALVLLTEDSRSGCVVAVTHGGVINALFSVITSGRCGTGKNFSENCGISLVAVGRDATVPVAYGLTGDMFLDYIKEYLECRNGKQSEK